MATIKTHPTGEDVTAFLDSVPAERRRAEGHALRALFERVTGEPAAIEGTTAQPGPEDAPLAPTRGTYRTILKREELEAAVAEARKAPRLAVDTETNSQDPMRAALVGTASPM